MNEFVWSYISIYLELVLLICLVLYQHIFRVSFANLFDNWQDYEGRTALHLAVADGNDAVVKALVSCVVIS